jgi:hypothetical protein
VDIGLAIGSIVRLQLRRLAGEFAQVTQLALGSSNLVYFCEPTSRTQLHMSVCVPFSNLARRPTFVRNVSKSGNGTGRGQSVRGLWFRNLSLGERNGAETHQEY